MTDRETEVLRLLVEELSNATIAERLVVSPKTIDHHIAAIYRKLGVHDRDAARRRAAQLVAKDGAPSGPT